LAPFQSRQDSARLVRNRIAGIEPIWRLNNFRKALLCFNAQKTGRGMKIAISDSAIGASFATNGRISNLY
jgi:hypothetical protein